MIGKEVMFYHTEYNQYLRGTIIDKILCGNSDYYLIVRSDKSIVIVSPGGVKELI